MTSESREKSRQDLRRVVGKAAVGSAGIFALGAWSVSEGVLNPRLFAAGGTVLAIATLAFAHSWWDFR